jgi:predicted transcriptional regulator
MLTPHQRNVLEIIFRGNQNGSFVDLDQILDRVERRTTKAAMQFVIRALIKKDLIIKHSREIRRGKSRMVYSPSVSCYERLRADMEKTASQLAALFES